MKRHHQLIEKIGDMDNLYLAFWKARKAKDTKSYVQEFRQNLQANLAVLSQQILLGSVNVGSYKYFKVFDPKERLICAAGFHERVLHHALMNVCHPVFEGFQIFDSYASRKGKGTYAAIRRALVFNQKHRWFLKLDVRKFFDSVDHTVLQSLLRRKFKEEKLLSIFRQIITSYSTTPGKGIPIGNLTSQYFANHYLAVADHYIQEQLKASGYVRYMDDMVIWDNDKQSLLDVGESIRSFTGEQLKLQLKPYCLNKTTKGLPFLGYVLFDKTMHLNQRSRKRFRARMNQYWYNLDSGIWDQSDYHMHITPLLAFAQKAESLPFRRKVMETLNEIG